MVKRVKKKSVLKVELYAGLNRRPSNLEDLYEVVEDLDIKKDWEVLIAPLSKKRNDLQNRLMWRWHAQWSKFNKYGNTGWAHGTTKLDILLNLKRGYVSNLEDKEEREAETEIVQRRGMIEAEILSRIPNREHKIVCAFDFVRSSQDVPERLFAMYLSEASTRGWQQNKAVFWNRVKILRTKL